jgi:hypothetical protein
MYGIALVVLAFSMSIVTMATEHRAEPWQRAVLGLTRRGLVLLALAFLALGAGVMRELRASNNERQDKQDLIATIRLRDAMNRAGQYERMREVSRELRVLSDQLAQLPIARQNEILGEIRQVLASLLTRLDQLPHLDQLSSAEVPPAGEQVMDTLRSELHALAADLDSIPRAAEYKPGLYYDRDGYLTVHEDGTPMRGVRFKP